MLIGPLAQLGTNRQTNEATRSTNRTQATEYIHSRAGSSQVFEESTSHPTESGLERITIESRSVSDSDSEVDLLPNQDPDLLPNLESSQRAVSRSINHTIETQPNQVQINNKTQNRTTKNDGTNNTRRGSAETEPSQGGSAQAEPP